MLEFSRDRHRIDLDHNRSYLQNPVIRDWKVRAVGQHDPYSIPFFNSQITQSCCKATHTFCQRLIIHLHSLEINSTSLWVALAGGFQYFWQGYLRHV
ncbi:Uncharacterised protein [Mycobacterium tuberculosis]|nr:Uncharacterised protein [Mycobacterium tuberculosis]